MTERKKLALKPSDEAIDPETLNKKGRGWKISDKRLDALHDRAREMRRFASPANKALAAKFAKADMGKYTFKRFAVVGSAIVDFNCHNLGMAIIIEEADDDLELSKRRDKSLEAVGIRVMRIKAEHILENMDKVLERITLGMRARIGDKKEAYRAHREENPNQDYPTRREPRGKARSEESDAREAKRSSDDDTNTDENEHGSAVEDTGTNERDTAE